MSDGHLILYIATSFGIALYIASFFNQPPTGPQFA